MKEPCFEADFDVIMENFVRSYHYLNLFVYDKKQKFYIREMDFLARLGESLGYFTFFRDRGMDPRYQREEPMDLAWYAKGRDNDHYRIVLRVETGKLFLKLHDELTKKF